MSDATPAHGSGAPGAPYGPATSAIRRFLVGLSALDAEGRAAVVERFAAVSGSRGFAMADAALADTIERSGRAEAQDALAGPLLQLVRRRQVAEGAQHAEAADARDAPEEADARDAPEEADARDAPDEADDDALDATAEPALAALLALLVRDLLPAPHFRTLYGPFEAAIPLETLDRP